MTEVQFDILKGVILASIEKSIEAGDIIELIFKTTDGAAFTMCHEQDCCEFVRVQDICGDLDDLIGSPILQAEATSNDTDPAPHADDAYEWTFYKLATIKGSVTIRWLGESNGYYGMRVSLYKE